MSILSTIKTTISRWLDPQAHRDAARYWRLWHGLDEARWWLGYRHPEAASLAQRLLDEDEWYWTSEKPTRCDSWTWQPPEHVSGIAAYRAWLDTKPFAEPVLQPGGR